ncbi:MAG: hypothetical protein OCC49_13905 [Fibrobacterales bacterium]
MVRLYAILLSYLVSMSTIKAANLEPFNPINLTTGNQDTLLFFFEALTWEGSDPDSLDTLLSYRIQIDDDSNFASPVLQLDTTASSVFISDFNNYSQKLTNETTYYWRVRAKDSDGLLSDYSVASLGYNFVNGVNMLDIPSVVSFSHTIKEPTDSLFWQSALYYDAEYTVELFRDDSSVIQSRTLIPSTNDSSMFIGSNMFISISHLFGDSTIEPFTSYFWTIQAFANNLGSLSGIRSERQHLFIHDSTNQLITAATTHAWSISHKDQEIFSADSLMVITIPDSAFGETTVTVLISELPGESVTDSSSSTGAHNNIVSAQNNLTADRFRRTLGQKIYAIDALNSRTMNPIAPLKGKEVILSQAIILNDTTLTSNTPIESATIAQLDTTRNEWAVQSSSLISIQSQESLDFFKSHSDQQLTHYMQHTTNHFSYYTILFRGVDSEPFSDFLVYPSPIILSHGTDEIKNAHISYSLTAETSISINIFSRTGKLVWSKDTIHIAPTDGLKSEIVWNGTNSEGTVVGNGYYVVKLAAKIKGIDRYYRAKQLIAVVK